jgi:hypothetical protein
MRSASRHSAADDLARRHHHRTSKDENKIACRCHLAENRQDEAGGGVATSCNISNTRDNDSIEVPRYEADKGGAKPRLILSGLHRNEGPSLIDSESGVPRNLWTSLVSGGEEGHGFLRVWV